MTWMQMHDGGTFRGDVPAAGCRRCGHAMEFMGWGGTQGVTSWWVMRCACETVDFYRADDGRVSAVVNGVPANAAQWYPTYPAALPRRGMDV